MAERLKGSRYDKAEASPGFLFWKAYNAWSRMIRTELEALELTQAQYSILAATRYLGSSQEHVTQQDLSNQLSMDKMMVSDVVKSLEMRELIQRARHPEDGRAFCLNLTAQGNQQLKKAVPAVESVDERFFGVLDEKKRHQLNAFLSELVRDGSL